MAACHSARVFVMPLLASALALASAACGGGHVAALTPQAPASASAANTTASPEEAAPQDETKTVTVDFTFDREAMNKDIDKAFSDGFERKGLKVDATLTAHAHFDVKDAKLTGTVTYVKRMGRYSIVEADLVASGHYDADVQIDMELQIKGDARNAKEGDWDKTLISGKPLALVKNVMPANIPIAGPLSLQAHFELSAACDMQVEGPMHATTGVGISGDVRLGTKYKADGEGAKSRFQFDAKVPNLELSPKPYLKLEGKQHRVKGRCSLQPTAVVLLDDAIGAKLSVEPYVDLESKRASARGKWQLDAQAGVFVVAATDLETIGRPMSKPREVTLFEALLTKPGDEMGPPPRSFGPSLPSKASRAPKIEVASMLDAGLAGAAQPAPVMQKRGAFGKKKKL